MMLLTSEVENVLSLNWSEIILGILAILIAIKVLYELFSFICNKFGIKFSWKERNDKDHATIDEHSHSLEKLIESNKDISTKMDSINTSISEISSKITNMEKEEMDAKIVDQVILADRLDQKARYYINESKGIPEDEYEAFMNMYKLYITRGDGNSGLVCKVEYCLKELQILPVNNSNYSNSRPIGAITGESYLAGKIIM